MKRAIVVAALVAAGCGGPKAGDPIVDCTSIPVGGAKCPSGALIHGCECILDHGQPIVGVVAGPSPYCASGADVTVACPANPKECSPITPGTSVVYVEWTCL